MSHKVLMVDDSPIDRAVYRSMLEQQMPGLTIDEVGGGQEAIRALKQRRYDCAFLDYEMPGASGLDVLEAVKGVSRTPVVMLTGIDDIDVAVAALRAGAIDYLVKDTLAAGQMTAALQQAVLHGHQRHAREAQMRHLALLQALLLQSEELFLVVDATSDMVIEAGTVGLAQLGIRRTDVVGRNAHNLELFAPEGWEALARRLAREPAEWQPTAPNLQTVHAHVQTLQVDGRPYVVLQARVVEP